MKWLLNNFPTRAIWEKAALEILSTNEGVKFAREFLANKKNERFILFEHLGNVFATAG